MTIDTQVHPSVGTATAARVVFGRTVATYRHSPALLGVSLAAPLGMVVLFGYVFGGTIAGDADPSAYRSYLMPGVFVLVASLGLMATAGTANADLSSGLTDRFRALPIARAGVPTGLALAETMIGAVALAAMMGIGYLVGWRIDAPAGEVALAVLLLFAFRAALSWLGILLGIAIRDEQVLQQAAPMIFGLIMLSNVFTPTEAMPSVVRAIAEWNPISAVVAALRELFGSGTAVAADAAWPMHHPVIAAFGWIAVILAVSVPVAVRQYGAQR
ncbi:ABC transporter permease [Rhodococcus artemisiae]|uniref:Transport permease protein n=1 Tax=Rhodococcus artemisiae TaxID=714159 RepID=A0ABU7LH39_9NOCA|nr:ABC transporter permease [Rhodococcus artemisiae]MEE2060879.1 ABC transporter permease [Rhodococcus artemisiae]